MTMAVVFCGNIQLKYGCQLRNLINKTAHFQDLCSVMMQVDSHILEAHAASIFRVEGTGSKVITGIKCQYKVRKQ